ncbi:MAG: hypothetical protein ACYS99_20895, partial [Planctomycetota bacterium]
SKQAITIERATARPRGRGRGLFRVVGRITTGVDGPDDVLDISNGLDVIVNYGGSLFAVGKLDADDCRLRKNGRIRGRTRIVKARFKPSQEVAGEYAFKIRLKVREFGDPVAGPLSLQIQDLRAVRAGVIDACKVHGKLRCRAATDSSR